METRALQAINAERRARRAVMSVLDLASGAERVVREHDAPTDGPLGAAIRKAFLSGVSQSVDVAGKAYFLNVYLPSPRLVVIGAVHISQALIPMARIAGYPVEIIDPRTAFASTERFGDVELSAEWPEDALKAKPLDSYCALAAVTHDPKIDDYALKAAIAAGCFYVGALGSRKTHARRVERLLAMGLTSNDLDRIHAPIGLDIRAASPAEIAVAILAQVIQSFRSRGSDPVSAAA